MQFKVGNLRVYFMPKKSNTVHLRLRTTVGSASEDSPSDYGAAHFLEHMMFKGTKNRTKEHIALELGRLGDSNAFTNFDETAYHMTTLPENFEKSLNILFDMFFHSKLDASEMEKERNVILEECQMYQDDPSSYFYDNLFGACFGSTAHPIIGTPKSISGISDNTIRNFINKHYTSGNVSLLVAGPITRVALERAIKRQDFDLPDGKKHKFPDLKLSKSESNFTHAAKQAILGLVYPGIEKHESFKRNLVDNVFRVCLGGGHGSLLFKKIREDLGLCYYVSCSEWSIAQNSLNIISTGMDRKNIDLARTEIDKVLKSVRKIGFPADVVEFAKQHLKYKVAGGGDSAPGVVGGLLSLQEELGEVTKDDLLKKIDSIENKDLIEFSQIFRSPKVVILNKK